MDVSSLSIEEYFVIVFIIFLFSFTIWWILKYGWNNCKSTEENSPATSKIKGRTSGQPRPSTKQYRPCSPVPPSASRKLMPRILPVKEENSADLEQEMENRDVPQITVIVR